MNRDTINAVPHQSPARSPALLGLHDLPPAETQRWVTRRKKKVVDAVRTGLISLEDACTRYTLSVEEFLSWERLIDRHGVAGLRATRIQHYRAVSDGVAARPES